MLTSSTNTYNPTSTPHGTARATLSPAFHSVHPQQIHLLHSHSHERPRLYQADPNPHPIQLMNENNTMDVNTYQYTNTPQQQLTPHPYTGEVDHEPLMLSMNRQNHYYPHLTGSMSSVSSDYSNETPNQDTYSNTCPNSYSLGLKRSREELNLKEKKRMLKLNDRINELKEILDEAGVQSKKNKQSILDNTSHYIYKLRSTLAVAKQKAERAEKQLNLYKMRKDNTFENADLKMYRRCFEQSSIARVIVTLHRRIQLCNSAFSRHAGLGLEALVKEHDSNRFICNDPSQFEEIIRSVFMRKLPQTWLVKACSVSGIIPVSLMTSLVFDDAGKPECIEFCLISVASQAFHSEIKDSKAECDPQSRELAF
uniref:DNA binding protein putative n=1 Tax=Albugo laibachii Nc14 TaxID=890382 RepID=F0W6A5_9STRA|nr:DNA binding protein putative [Albugo laibachii Nc14]|eukprot:CCA16648.1 DNA binding protein putative [Albugo laibachii Nc14]